MEDVYLARHIRILCSDNQLYNIYSYYICNCLGRDVRTVKGLTPVSARRYKSWVRL